jgi:threonine dehydrogenase-like Zn-dependent dehydrogenase
MVDHVKQNLKLAQDRPHVLREAIRAVRKCGTLSVPGVYAGYLDKVPFGAAFGKGITIRGGQTHMHKYMPPLLKLVEDGKIDPSFVVTHRVPLSKAPDAYETFLKKQNGCIKVVLNPHK